MVEVDGVNVLNKLVWIGARESDKEYTGDFFEGSVTLYGKRKKENKSFCLTKDYRINHNNITDEQTAFMVENELQLIEKNPDIKFMAYNPNLIYDCDERVIEHTICLNNQNVMQFLDSKFSFRNFAKKYVHTLHSEHFRGNECTVQVLKRKFPGEKKWIIQSDIASGGYKTFILSEENEKDIVEILSKDEEYLVSPFYEKNIPVNIHAIIYDEEILVTPGSIQIMGLDKNRMLYRGADYIAYRSISKSILDSFTAEVRVLCQEIQKLGYRGIIGIDAIIVENIAWILEVNNRFQASTILINKALKEYKLPSIHELNYEAFQSKKSDLIGQKDLDELVINYSIYAFIQNEQKYHVKNIMKAYKSEKSIVQYIDDGYIMWQDAEDEAYLFRVVFNTNIVSITTDSCVRLHPNIKEPEKRWYNDIVKEDTDYKKLKIALLNQGVILSKDVKEYLNRKGGMREGVYFAVDLTINRHYIVNSPLYVKLVSLSPFWIKLEKEKLYLYFYENKVAEVEIAFADPIAEKVTTKGIPVSRICLLATDRLRIQNSDFCTFKEGNIPCRFCEAEYKNIEFDLDDICECLDLYFRNRTIEFKHILIGGLSNTIGKEKENIEGIIKYIRQYSDMPIYLMCLPDKNIENIKEYVKLGVNEIGYNIEVFDRKLALKYMPGKGKISLEQYRTALEEAVRLLGKKGAVRSAFIVGLESKESLLEGVKYVCRMGVAPVLSVFRPIPFTEMQDVIPPENEWLLEIYDEVEKICSNYGLKPGPTCEKCQNNTLAFDILKVGDR